MLYFDSVKPLNLKGTGCINLYTVIYIFNHKNIYKGYKHYILYKETTKIVSRGKKMKQTQKNEITKKWNNAVRNVGTDKEQNNRILHKRALQEELNNPDDDLAYLRGMGF